MFSQTAEYTLRVVVFLATLEGRPATTRQIAAATRVPEGYLAKIIQTLARAGLVAAQRGRGGGSILARSPDQITMFDVIEAVSPLPRITTCPLGLPSHGTRLCAVHKRLDDAMAVMAQTFKEATIAGMLAVDPGRGSVPLEGLGTSNEVATRAAEVAFPVVAVTVGRRRKA